MHYTAQGITVTHQEFRYGDGSLGSRAFEVFTSLRSGQVGQVRLSRRTLAHLLHLSPQQEASFLHPARAGEAAQGFRAPRAGGSVALKSVLLTMDWRCSRL